MAIMIEDECVGCPADIGCLGLQCPNRNVKHYYCDECEEEEQLYYFEGKELCIECIKAKLEKVE